MSPVGTLLKTFAFSLAVILTAFVFPACGKEDVKEGKAEVATYEKQIFIEGVEEYETGLADLKARNYEDAVKSFKAGAEKGNVEALLMLGHCYQNGDGVEQDLSEAANWYRKAAETGDPRAQLVFGFHLLLKDAVREGTRPPIAGKEAIGWVEKSANQGFAPAQVMLGALLRNEDDVRALKYFNDAANQPLSNKESALDHMNLGSWERYGLPASPSRKMTYEDINIVIAQMQLAMAYAEGRGTKKDLQQAKKWAEKAKENGCPYADELIMGFKK